MVLAADYPFLDVFWTMILFFFWVAWIAILVTIVMDLFRRHDASGWTKALWLVLLIFLPFLGVLAYLIANGDGMGKRNVERAQVRDEAARITDIALSGSPDGKYEGWLARVDLVRRHLNERYGINAGVVETLHARISALTAARDRLAALLDDAPTVDRLPFVPSG